MLETREDNAKILVSIRIIYAQNFRSQFCQGWQRYGDVLGEEGYREELFAKCIILHSPYKTKLLALPNNTTTTQNGFGLWALSLFSQHKYVLANLVLA